MAKVVTRIIPALIIVVFIVYSGLLSGDEMGMLEDACVSIANLTCVKFKVNMRSWFQIFINILYKNQQIGVVPRFLIEENRTREK